MMIGCRQDENRDRQKKLRLFLQKKTLLKILLQIFLHSDETSDSQKIFWKKFFLVVNLIFSIK